MQFKVFTPTEYIEFLNEGLKDFSAVLEGEVSEYKVSQNKWIFFKLKDEYSTIECFAVKFQIRIPPIEDGMRVRLFGIPRVYPKSGRFSLYVQWIEVQGEGSLQKAFELLKEELKKEGLFLEERKREIPQFPKRIGLITSKESAAFKDFIKVLKHRFGGIDIYLYDVSVQGEGSVLEIVEAFEYFNKNQEKLKLDLIVLTRGGGSLEDLQSFNSKEVAYAVFGSLVPVVCGVGHERDVSIADLVADKRASTPSNAAELISPQREDLILHIKNQVKKIEEILKKRVLVKKEEINGLVFILNSFLSEKIEAFNFQKERIVNAFLMFFQEQKFKLSKAKSMLDLCLKKVNESLIIQKSQLESFLRLIESFNPQNVLKRGYGIVKSENKVVSSVKKIRKGDEVEIFLKDGSFDSMVKKMIHLMTIN